LTEGGLCTVAIPDQWYCALLTENARFKVIISWAYLRENDYK